MEKIRILDPASGMKKIRIRDEHPGSATLWTPTGNFSNLKFLCWGRFFLPLPRIHWPNEIQSGSGSPRLPQNWEENAHLFLPYPWAVWPARWPSSSCPPPAPSLCPSPMSPARRRNFTSVYRIRIGIDLALMDDTLTSALIFPYVGSIFNGSPV